MYHLIKWTFFAQRLVAVAVAVAVAVVVAVVVLFSGMYIQGSQNTKIQIAYHIHIDGSDTCDDTLLAVAREAKGHRAGNRELNLTINLRI